jgi:hypothetical protein
MVLDKDRTIGHRRCIHPITPPDTRAARPHRKVLMKIKPGSPARAASSTGIRAALTAQTETDLTHIRHQLARLGDDDVTRPSLIEREAELNRLLDDLEHHVPSASVLAAAALIRA